MKSKEPTFDATILIYESDMQNDKSGLRKEVGKAVAKEILTGNISGSQNYATRAEVHFLQNEVSVTSFNGVELFSGLIPIGKNKEKIRFNYSDIVQINADDKHKIFFVSLNNNKTIKIELPRLVKQYDKMKQEFINRNINIM